MKVDELEVSKKSDKFTDQPRDSYFHQIFLVSGVTRKRRYLWLPPMDWAQSCDKVSLELF